MQKDIACGYYVLKWILYNFVWLLIAAPALSAWMIDNEWPSLLSNLLNLIYSTSMSIFGEAAFPWVAGALFGLALGVALHRLWAHFSNAFSKKEKQFSKLEVLTTNVLWNMPDLSGLSGLRQSPDAALGAHILRLFGELTRLEVATPNLGKPTLTDSDRLEIVDTYVRFLQPFLEDRDINILRREAEYWTKHSGQ